jgi:hypothetical protein
MWCDVLNTLISQVPPTLDKLTEASPLHLWCNASPTPHTHALFQPPLHQPSYPTAYHYPSYPYTPPPIGGLSGGNAHPPYPYLHFHHMDTHHIHIIHIRLVVHQVVLFLNHIHILHLNLFISEVMTTQVEGTTPSIQLKLCRG